jgi:alkanesulfonate monooxygenase SsuD/methylene tetrahydromethanopterin reductase-like flavin-dependent oxidoreductase (luciferase family)
VLIAPDRGAANLVDDALDKARAAHDAGVGQLWLGQQLDYDAIGLAAVIGTAIPDVAVGTSVVPINPRHPLIVAAAAQTAQAATHGKFSLGLGLGVPFLEESVFGLTTGNTVQRLREYLTVLLAIRDDRTVNFHGSQITAVDPSVLPVAMAGATPFPLYVAAMGPRALQVSGELADGTLRPMPDRAPSKDSSHRRSRGRPRTPGGHLRASSRWSASRSPTMSRRLAPPPPPGWPFTTQFRPTGRCLRAKVCPRRLNWPSSGPPKR